MNAQVTLPDVGIIYQIPQMHKMLTSRPVRPGCRLLHRMEVSTSRCRVFFLMWQWNVMPFGLHNAPSTWQHVINDTLFEGLGSFCCAYVDDIIIWSPSEKQHHLDVRTVLQRLRDEGLSINVEKCEFDVQVTRYLGHIRSTSGIRPDPRKVQALVDWPVPRTTKEVHQFHGLHQQNWICVRTP